MIGGWLLATTNYLAVTHGDSSVYLLYILPLSNTSPPYVSIFISTTSSHLHLVWCRVPSLSHITSFPVSPYLPLPISPTPSLILLLQGVMFISDVSLCSIQFYIKTFSLTTKPKIFKKRTSEARINASDAPLNHNNAIS